MWMPSASTHLDPSPVSVTLVSMATDSTALQVDSIFQWRSLLSFGLYHMGVYFFQSALLSSHLLRPTTLTLNCFASLFIFLLNTTKAKVFITGIFWENSLGFWTVWLVHHCLSIQLWATLQYCKVSVTQANRKQLIMLLLRALFTHSSNHKPYQSF